MIGRTATFVKEIAANHRAMRRALLKGFLGEYPIRDGRRSEVARYLQLLVLHDDFTFEVIRIRRRYKDEWRRIPKWCILPSYSRKSPLAKEVETICYRFRLDGIVINKDRFLPWIGRPYPSTPLIGSSLRGRPKLRTRLQRINNFDERIDLYVELELGADHSEKLPIESAKRITAKSKERAIRDIKHILKTMDTSVCSRPKTRKKRRVFARADWMDDTLRK